MLKVNKLKVSINSLNDLSKFEENFLGQIYALINL